MANFPILVLMPGLDGTGLLFQPFVQTLKKLEPAVPIKIIAYPCDQALSLDELADILVEELQTLNNCVLLAESFSGLVALQVLQKTPISGVIFCASFAHSPRPRLLKMAAFLPGTLTPWHHLPDFVLRWCGLGSNANPVLIDLVQRSLHQVQPAVLQQRLRAIAQTEAPTIQFSLPCYYLQATADSLVPAQCADWFMRHFAECKLQAIKGPHFLLQTQPAQCAQAVLRFLASQ